MMRRVGLDEFDRWLRRKWAPFGAPVRGPDTEMGFLNGTMLWSVAEPPGNHLIEVSEEAATHGIDLDRLERELPVWGWPGDLQSFAGSTFTIRSSGPVTQRDFRASVAAPGTDEDRRAWFAPDGTTWLVGLRFVSVSAMAVGGVRVRARAPDDSAPWWLRFASTSRSFSVHLEHPAKYPESILDVSEVEILQAYDRGVQELG